MQSLDWMCLRGHIILSPKCFARSFPECFIIKAQLDDRTKVLLHTYTCWIIVLMRYSYATWRKATKHKTEVSSIYIYFLSSFSGYLLHPCVSVVYEFDAVVWIYKIMKQKNKYIREKWTTASTWSIFFLIIYLPAHVFFIFTLKTTRIMFVQSWKTDENPHTIDLFEAFNWL